jgi:type II secretory pathway pseudopilin PulG
VEPKRFGSIVPILVALLLIGLLAGGYFVPRMMTERRWANERAARAAMRMLPQAEAAFRTNDADKNGIQDFWTGDVAGLYTYGLIPREIAEADVAPLVPLVPQPIPYHGHYFKALLADDSESPPAVYRQVTDKKSGAVHNIERFGFVAYPAGGLASPKYMWIINEYNMDFRSPTTVPVPDNWPTDLQLKHTWAKVD